MRRALHLFSGGLDSILSYKILQESNIDVEAVYFETPFFPSAGAVEYGRLNGITVRIINIFPEYIPLIKSPKYGYGKNLNPCIDCHAMMINRALKILEEEKFDFISTGEVLGQRPMSQTKDGFRKQEVLLKRKDIVFRVLSQGDFTDEEKYKGIPKIKIIGRERTIQIQMAKERGITKYHTPSGGCYLTYKEYSAKARGLLKKNFLEERYFYMIKRGRFVEFENAVSVIGRDEFDNAALLKMRQNEDALQIIGGKGPVSLIIGKLNELEKDSLKEILLSYSKKRPDEKDLICSI